MNTKAAFEKFVIKHDPSGHCTNLLAMNEAGTNYLHPHVDIAWISWTASRAEIEIDLPQRQSLCASGYGDGYFVPSSTGEGLEYDEVVEAITSHGIRIKGKAE